MKGSISNKLRKALCALFAGALVITSVPTANVAAYADEVQTTSAAVKELSYDVSALEVEQNGSWGYTVNSENGYSIAFEKQYAQVNYKIPADVDVSKLVSIKVDAEATNLCIKLLDKDSVEFAVAYDTNEVTQESLADGKGLINDPKLKCIGLMTKAEGAATVAIGKITFKVQADATEETKPEVTEPVEETKPEVTEPAEEQKPEVTEPAEEQKPETTPTEEKKPVTTKVTGKAITVTAGKTATIKMPIKKAKIKSVKYSKLSAKAAKVVKIDKKNNKVKGLKAGKATVKATVTKKNGDKIVMTTKVTVKAAPKPAKKPTQPTTPQAKDYSYTMDKLNSFAAWDVTASGSGSNYKVTFSRQYAQIFYEIPSEVDVANLKSVVVEFDDSSKVAIKLGQKFVEYSDTESVYGIVYETDTFAYGAENVTLANSKIAKKDINWVNFMNLQDGSLTRTIKKITFKL